MPQTFTGTLVDPVQKTSFGARVILSDHGTIAAIEHEPNPDVGFILPGFVDAHVHIESSMLTPAAFARAAVVHGTLAAVADPHEIANVLGERGVELMLDLARQTPFVFGFGVPSCVPATPFETAGAELDPDAVARLLDLPGITHLAEMMNVPGVLNNDPAVRAKLDAARQRGLPIDGHAPGLCGDPMRAYVAAGITTDHESLTFEEAREKLKVGLMLQIRYGSAARRFEPFLPLLPRFPELCMFCSDDKHPDDLLRDHINYIVATAFRQGLALQTILQAACVNPVRHYRLPLGLLQVGDSADFQIVDDLRTFRPREVWLRGQCVARDGVSLLSAGEPIIDNNFKAQPITADALRIPVQSKRRVRVIGVRDGELVTAHLLEKPRVSHQGTVIADPERDIVKLVVCNRYAPAAPAIGLVKGFGLKRGALATSVSHDSHHVIAIGASDNAIVAAINEVIHHRGGLAVADSNRKILTSLPLPLAGLISTGPAECVAKAYSDCDRLAKILGSPLSAPFMTLSFLALSVIPSLKLTDKGLFDGDAFRHVALFEEAP
ncbi:MAG TPA: adenine deaminase [Kiritimatiellia bacterium]|nr:adenine deaminase [Kiritimatiellia bacterium]HRU70343.1 adenine deaminase [Kiritimatiellia bacterium]